jgi:positive regulator of sigma E activity
MSKEIRNLLLIYVVPMLVLALFMVFFAPPMFSVGILAMFCSAGLLVVAMAFLIDYLDKKGN